MSVQHVTQSMLTKTNEKQQIRPGQILYGKITKIHPNNQAELQIGSRVIHAQLEAPLSVGSQYYFQVENVDEKVHLKVVSERMQANQTLMQRAESLLKQLHLPTKKNHIALVASFIKDNISFSKVDLEAAFKLMNKASNKTHAVEVIQQLFSRNLPMSEQTFRALSEVGNHSLSHTLQQLFSELVEQPKLSSVEQRLMQQISQFLHPESRNELGQTNFARYLLNNDRFKSQDIFHFLRTSGAIEENISFSDWKNAWQKQSNSQQSLMRLPFNIDLNHLRTALQHVQNNTMAETVSANIAREWGTTINLALINSQPLPQEQFELLQRQVLDQLFPLLNEKQQAALTSSLVNKEEQLIRLLAQVRALASPQIQQMVLQIEPIIQQMHMEGQQTTVQHHFLNYLQQYMHKVGLSYEYSLNQELQNTNMNDIKPMLIQLSQSDSAVQARAQQVLHFINGMQMQSLTESNQLLQATLQIPGEPFSLNKDMLMNFESKKTEDGKINSEYCRILFYLDLKSLNEVVIDLQIQKKIISISVFNDHPQIKNHALLFEPLLQEKLQESGYQLSSVSFHYLEEREKEKQTSHTVKRAGDYEGYDFRV